MAITLNFIARCIVFSVVDQVEEAIIDCNDELSGSAIIDQCGICAGGDAADIGCGCFASEAQEYWYDSDGDDLGYGEEELFCSNLGDILTNNTISTTLSSPLPFKSA